MVNKLKLKTKKGFTMVEILVAMLLASIILVALYGIFVISSKVHQRGIVQQELAQNARISLDRISRDLRQTAQITTTLPPTNTDTLNPPPSEIQFQDGHTTAKIQYIRYYLTGNNLNRQVIHYAFSAAPSTWVLGNVLDNSNNPPVKTVDEDVTKANKVVSIQFYGDKVVNIDMVVGDGTTNFSFETAVLGRNI